MDANPASNQVDFVSIVLHELIHGLGFIDSFDIAEDSSQGTFGVGENLIPVVYDIFLEDGSGSVLITFDNPSADLLAAMSGDDLFFGGPEAISANGGAPPKVFAPFPLLLGSSIAHWDEDTFPSGDPNALMTPFTGGGEANHDPGPNTIGLFRDLGYLNAMQPFTAQADILVVTYLSTGDVPNLAAADALIGGQGLAGIASECTATVNYWDGGFEGNFPNSVPFPGGFTETVCSPYFGNGRHSGNRRIHGRNRQ